MMLDLDFRFGDEARRKLLNFWNIYVFFNTYAVLDMPNLKDYKLDKTKLEKSDKWLLARMNKFLKVAKQNMEKYEVQDLVKEFEIVVDDISNFYIRVNRKRFWKIGEDEDKLQVYYLLYNAIKQITGVMAPIIPFMTEEIWQNMIRSFEPDEVESVHLSNYPQANDEYDNEKILEEVFEARKVIALGLMLRNEKQLKVRQPLNKMYIFAKEKRKEAVNNFANIIQEELNVKEIDFVENENELDDEFLMVNFKVAGSLLKDKMQDFKIKLESLSEDKMQDLVTKFNDENVSKLEVEEFGKFEKDTFLKSTKPKKNIVVIKENDYIVALDTSLTEDLVIEGMARDLVRTIQVLRKDAGLKVEQRINLSIVTEGSLMKKVIEEYINKITEETLTNAFKKEKIIGAKVEKELEINDEKLIIYISELN